MHLQEQALPELGDHNTIWAKLTIESAPLLGISEEPFFEQQTLKGFGDRHCVVIL